MKKKCLSDATKFTLAISLVLLMLLSCITVITVFNAMESRDESKAETVSDTGYSFAVHNNVYDGQFANLAITNNVAGDQWNKLFVYFADDGSPATFFGTKSNFHVSFDFYNPNRVGLAYVALNTSAEGWINIFGGYDIASDDMFIRRTVDYGTVVSEVGSVLFEIASQLNVYLTHLQVSFTWNSHPVVISFGSQTFYDSYSAAYDTGYNAGFLDGYSSGTTIWEFEDGVSNSGIIGSLTNPTSTGFTASSDVFEGNSIVSFRSLDVPFVDTDYYLSCKVDLTAHSSPVYFDGNFTVSNPLSFPDSYLVSDPVILPDVGIVSFSFRDISFSSSLSSSSNLSFLFRFTSAAPFTVVLSDLKVTSAVGFQSGYDLGYQDGFNRGSDQGYWSGYNQGASDHGTYSFLGLMGAVIDAPIQAILKMLDFIILGINMQGFYLSLFTLCIVITVIKFVLVKN